MYRENFLEGRWHYPLTSHEGCCAPALWLGFDKDSLLMGDAFVITKMTFPIFQTVKLVLHAAV